MSATMNLSSGFQNIRKAARRNLALARDWFSQWEKLITVPGAALSFLLSIGAIVIALTSLLRTTINERAELTSFVGGFPMIVGASSSYPILSDAPDSIRVGHLFYKVNADALRLRSALARLDQSPANPGIDINLTQPIAVSVLYVLVGQDFMQRSSPMSSPMIPPFRTRGSPAIAVPSAFEDSVNIYPVELAYGTIAACLQGVGTVGIPRHINGCTILVSNTGQRQAIVTGLALTWEMYEYVSDEGTGDSPWQEIGSSAYEFCDYVERSDVPLEQRRREMGRAPLAIGAQGVSQLEVALSPFVSDSLGAVVEDHLESLWHGDLGVLIHVTVHYHDGKRARSETSQNELLLSPLLVPAPGEEPGEEDEMPLPPEKLRDLWQQLPGFYLAPSGNIK